MASWLPHLLLVPLLALSPSWRTRSAQEPAGRPLSLQLHAGAFSQQGFLVAGNRASFLQGDAAVSFSPLPWLELDLAFGGRWLQHDAVASTHRSLGDVGATLVLRKDLGPLALGLELGLTLPSGYDDKPGFDGLSERAGILASFGLRSGSPLRVHVNATYVRDRGRNLSNGRPSPVAAYAVGLWEVDHVDWGLLGELPLGYVTPFVELSGEAPLNSAPTDAWPTRLSPGLRVSPVDAFDLSVAVDIGLTRGRFVGVLPEPDYRVWFGLSYALYTADRDLCPDEDEDMDGFEDEDGCPDPDNDGDGVLDAEDRCPLVAGAPGLAGCADPDPDHDGISGADDLCPDATEDADGFEDEDGCPDADNDHDGMLDTADRCPNDAEDFDHFEDEDGCPEPDNDRDGVLDAADRCPREAEDRDGFEDEDGCADADNDGDGVPDRQDGPLDPGGEFGVCRNLPETPGGPDADAPDGCPDRAVRVDVEARRIRVPPVFFDSGADVIQQRSFEDLQYVAEAVAANAWIEHIDVEGHTDDRGNDSYNMDLSQRRAASVVHFLVEHGIAASRLTSHGFGRSRPPSAEDVPACSRPRSSECRQARRRVVFVIDRIAAPAAESDGQ